MCGIVGYIGRRDAIPVLLEGLRSLEYRGYDSAGLAVVHRRRTVQLDSPGVHRHPQERHVVLPADHGAEPADRRLEDGQG